MPTQLPPKVYIHNILMNDLGVEDNPVLASINIDFGVDNELDFQKPETCSLELLIKYPDDMSFLEIGHVVGVIHDDGVAAPFTYFVGRISNMNATRVKIGEGFALRVHINAVDFGADLENIKVFNVDLGQVDANSRYSQIGTLLMFNDWQTSTWPLRYNSSQHAHLKYKDVPLLTLFDQFLRAQIMRRYIDCAYVPDPANNSGSTTKRLILAQDHSDIEISDTLQKDAAGEWYVLPATPDTENGGNVSIYAPASKFHEDAEWVKDNEDVITNVTLQRIDPYNGVDDSKFTPINSAHHIDTTLIEETYGERSVEFDTDYPAGTAIADMLPIFDHWLNTKSKWRIKTLRFVDTSEFPLSDIRAIISPAYRFRTWLAVGKLPENRPQREYSIMRGLILGGTATWEVVEDGQPPRWNIEVNLSRDTLSPTPTATGWTYTMLEADPTFSATTFTTVGKDVTFADFSRIGA